MDKEFTILLLEDDPNDVLLLKRALQKNGIQNPVQVLPDGIEGIAYFSRTGKYADRDQFPLPRVMIIDLKMPRMGGLEFLQWLKDHPEFRIIPTLVLSSSRENVDVAKAYALGANSYMVKPANFQDLENLIKIIHEYWQRSVTPYESGPS
jgi:CheY-like chemotaxis protein